MIGMRGYRLPVDWSLVEQCLASGDFGAGRVLRAPYSVSEADARQMVCGLRWGHYVYALCSGDVVFYIGKGAGTRALQHRVAAAAGDASDKSEFIRRLGDGLRYCILVVCDSDDAASLIEAHLIQENWPLLLNKRPESPDEVMARVRRKEMADEVARYLDLSNLAARAAGAMGIMAAGLHEKAKRVNAFNWRTQ